MPAALATRFKEGIASDPLIRERVPKAEALRLLASIEHNYVLFTGASYDMDAMASVCGLESRPMTEFPPNLRGIYSHEKAFVTVEPQHVTMAQAILARILRMSRNGNCPETENIVDSISAESMLPIFLSFAVILSISIVSFALEKSQLGRTNLRDMLILVSR
jgi:hypothetical protein